MDAIGKIAFWAGILCELIVSVSGYAYGGYHEPAIIVLGMLFFSISICMHLELKKNWKLYLICAVVGLGYYYLQSSALILRILLILLAGREQKAEQVIKCFFWGTLVIMICTAVLAALGLHNTLSLTQNFRHEEETRYCFGFYHPNGFAFFFFRTLVLGLYTYGKQLKLWMMAVVAAASMILFWMAGSKMGMTAAVCVIVAFWLVRYFKTDQTRKTFYFIGNVLMALEVLFLMVSMVCFVPSVEIALAGEGFWQILNELTTGRLFFIHKTFLEYPIPLWGYQGFMEATEVGFVNAMYNQGLVFLMVYLAALFYLFYRMYRKKDMSALVLILGFTLYAMAEAFLPYFNKNGIWMLFIGWNLYRAGPGKEEVNEKD
ncbi:MAG: hypothetical protein K2J95_09615 [Lachnospiraceae bacterium]|nr:hypothetical protein [Lachnospiraceae bacterium]